MFINNISESKGDTFKTCRLKYKFKYVDKLPEGASGKGAMDFGSFIHKIFEEGFEATTVEELLAIGETVRDKYTFDKSYSDKKIRTCCENFLKFNKKLSKTIGRETKFKLLLEEDMSFNGVIDRIIEGTDDGLLIIDYKTSKNEKTKMELFHSSQLKGYAYAASQIYKKPINQITVAHYYPITGNFVALQYSVAQINAWLMETKNLIWKIRKTKKEDCKPCRNQFCNWCPYRPICSEFNSPEDIAPRLEAAQKEKERLDELKNEPNNKL